MNPKRRLTPAQTASAALAGVLALGVLILALSRPQRGHDVQAAAAALAARADATNAATPRELLSVLRAGRGLRRRDTPHYNRWSLDRAAPECGPVEQRRVPRARAFARGCRDRARQPGADSGGTGFTHNAAIVGGLVALLGLMAAYGASAWAQGAREARVTRDRSRDQVSASPPRVPPPRATAGAV